MASSKWTLLSLVVWLLAAACGGATHAVLAKTPSDFDGTWAGCEGELLFEITVREDGTFDATTVFGDASGTCTFDNETNQFIYIEFDIFRATTTAHYRGYMCETPPGDEVAILGRATATDANGVQESWCWWLVKAWRMKEGALPPGETLPGWRPEGKTDWVQVDAPECRLVTTDGSAPDFLPVECPDPVLMRMPDPLVR